MTVNDDDDGDYEGWCRAILDLIRDGGIWAIPRSQCVFRVDKGDRTLTLVSGDRACEDFGNTKWHFAKIGWKVI